MRVYCSIDISVLERLAKKVRQKSKGRVILRMPNSSEVVV